MKLGCRFGTQVSAFAYAAIELLVIGGLYVKHLIGHGC